MKNISIELKKVKTFRGTDFPGFNAEVFINGKKACAIIDEGNGGGIQVREVFNESLVKMAEDHAKLLPKTPFEYGGKKHMVPVTFETLIDEAYNKIEEQKELKKLEKKFVNTIIWGIPGGDSYTQIKFPRALSEYPTEALQNKLNDLKAKLKKGEKFLNTNFTSLKVKV